VVGVKVVEKAHFEPDSVPIRSQFGANSKPNKANFGQVVCSVLLGLRVNIGFVSDFRLMGAGFARFSGVGR
jgi:hypothetical protein